MYNDVTVLQRADTDRMESSRKGSQNENTQLKKHAPAVLKNILAVDSLGVTRYHLQYIISHIHV